MQQILNKPLQQVSHFSFTPLYIGIIISFCLFVGFLEGYLSKGNAQMQLLSQQIRFFNCHFKLLIKDLIDLHLINTVGDFCSNETDDKDICGKLKAFLVANFNWMLQEIKANKDDPYWQQVQKG